MSSYPFQQNGWNWRTLCEVNKLGSERQVPYNLTYKWNLINKTKKHVNITRDIEIKNKLTVTRGEGGGDNGVKRGKGHI